jgi:methanogenic corrinoid protein MtbC1
LDPLSELVLLIEQGENVGAVALSSRLLKNSYGIEDIVHAVSKGVAILRNKCTVENFQLLDVLLASRAMVEVIDECIAQKLKETMDGRVEEYEKRNISNNQSKKTLVIGTIRGDVHDLGKHIVATLCRFSNLRVRNLGKDVPVETFVEEAIKEKADFVGVSSLMTVCLPKIKEIKPALIKKGYGHIKIIGGGAAVQQSNAERLNLDYLAYDAFEGLDYLTTQRSEVAAKK